MHPPYFFKINFHVIVATPDSFTWFHPSIFPTTATYAIISRHMCQFPTHLMPQYNGEHVTTSVGMYANTVRKSDKIRKCVFLSSTALVQPGVTVTQLKKC